MESGEDDDERCWRSADDALHRPRRPADAAPRVGSRRELAVDPARFHFFDPESGLALATPAPEAEAARTAALSVE